MSVEMEFENVRFSVIYLLEIITINTPELVPHWNSRYLWIRDIRRPLDEASYE